MWYDLFGACFLIYDDWLLCFDVFRILCFKHINTFLVVGYLNGISLFAVYLWNQLNTSLRGLNYLRWLHFFSKVSFVKTSARVFTAGRIVKLVFSFILPLSPQIYIPWFQLMTWRDFVLIKQSRVNQSRIRYRRVHLCCLSRVEIIWISSEPRLWSDCHQSRPSAAFGIRSSRRFYQANLLTFNRANFKHISTRHSTHWLSQLFSIFYLLSNLLFVYHFQLFLSVLIINQLCLNIINNLWTSLFDAQSCIVLIHLLISLFYFMLFFRNKIQIIKAKFNLTF